MPISLPAQVVTISAIQASATEAGVFPGVLRIERTGSQAVSVQLAYSGTAEAGHDFESLAAAVEIPAGVAYVDLTVNPINNPTAQMAANTVVATIAPSTGYSIGSPSSATITIADDDTLTNTAPLLYELVVDSPTSVVAKWTDVFQMETRFRVQYRPLGSGTWLTLDNIPANSTEWRVDGLSTGISYEFRVTAFQGSTSSQTQSPATVVVAASVGSESSVQTFERWRREVGLAGANRLAAGRTFDDPDGDGTSNLIEYALGGNPWEPDRVGPALGVAGPTGVSISWAEPDGVSDVDVELRHSDDLTSGWVLSPLVVTANGTARGTVDSVGSDRRFYQLAMVPLVPRTPSSTITCWGDSLTGNPGTYATKLPQLLPGRTVRNCGIGGDISYQIVDRMRGLTITAPFPSFSPNTPAGTPVRIVASRTTHARLMSTSQRSNWGTQAATIGNAQRVEFFNLGQKIGESSAPLTAMVTSQRSVNASRILAAGHPFSNGDVVHFPSGPLPSPLVVGKPYYVKNPDATGFSLVESDVAFSITANSTAPSGRFDSAGHPFVSGTAVWFRRGASPPSFFSDRFYYVRDVDPSGFSLAATPGGSVVTTVYNSTGAIMGPPGTPLSLATDFSAPTNIRGPFVFEWTHPGGATNLTLRTHTDRDAETFIFWMGRNNSARPHETYAELREAIDHIKALDARFLIVSVTNGGGESAGSPYYYNVVNLNALLRREFPNEFVDVRTALVRAASASADDQIDRAADIPPRSLRTDNVHFNDAGHQLIAEILASRLTTLGW
ncbi:MAG: fibronectin type III domain-containing protein [Terrimicrobiaceae bacterium]|nr:fibronectin type III domain-containing protein [Terrimicrobiaceae bacterium]